MKFEEVDTPLGKVTLHINYYLKELEEKKYSSYEAPAIDKVTVYIVRDEPVLINGIPTKFSLNLKKEVGSTVGWRYEYLNANRTDRGWCGEATEGAKTKVRSLSKWLDEYLKDKQHIIFYQAREESIKEAIQRCKADAEELKKKAAEKFVFCDYLATLYANS